MLASCRSSGVDWTTLADQLPLGRDDASRSTRRKLFRSFDPNGNGILSLAEVGFGLSKVLKFHGIAAAVVNRAFHAARDIAPPVATFSNNYIDKNEFRVLLVYLTYYLQLWEYFERIDTSNDRRLGPREFCNALPLLQRWGLKVAREWAADPMLIFKQMDIDGGGKVLFDEFADFCLRHGLAELAGDHMEERQDALEILREGKANLTTKGGQNVRGIPTASPPAPGKMLSTRWETTYKRHFPTTARNERSITGAAAFASLHTPRGIAEQGSRQYPYFDSKLNMPGQVDVCSTDQLRNVLTLAGNKVITPRLSAQPFARPQRRMKALSIAINYIGMRGELQGCFNDQDMICDLWRNVFKVPADAIQTLRDDDRSAMPTKNNMMNSLRWLAQDAKAGDMLFFHYSGHGGQTRDEGGDERDKCDETLIPVDYQKAGMIKDDELRRLLVLALPEGVSLLGLMDCCHSGTGMDLPFVATLGSDGRSVKLSKKPRRYVNGTSLADVVMLSGCKDSQTSADARIGSEYSGAMTKALQEALRRRPDASFHRVLQLMRRYLQAGRYSQVPQMSSERPIRLDAAFNLGPGGAKQSHLLKPVGKARRKALSIAINYIGQRGELRGCINDQEAIVRLWTTRFGLQPGDIQTLRDDDRCSMPTKVNILAAMERLVRDARPGDRLYFHYSGHGGQQKDTGGDERDQRDETLIPCDYQQSGMISDDELRKILVLSLPQGASLFGLMDCCHSGTGMDLPFVVTLDEDGRSVTLSKKPAKCIAGKSLADVVMISGCKDTQTSADAQIGNEYSGAMTKAFQECLTSRPRVSYHHLIQSMRTFLKRGNYTQVPQMSSERMVNLAESVLPLSSSG